MTRTEVIERLRHVVPELGERFGVSRLDLFGSLARGDDSPGSDIDVLVDFNRPITLFDLVAVRHYLEQHLDHCKVDVVPRDSIYPEFSTAILGEAVHVR